MNYSYKTKSRNTTKEFDAYTGIFHSKKEALEWYKTYGKEHEVSLGVALYLRETLVNTVDDN